MNYKRVPLEHLLNCRDLGGYGCTGGKMIRYGRLYRSEAPTHLTDQEWLVIKEMGVRTIIDLRSESEQGFAPYTAPEFIKQISYPLLQGGSLDFGKADEGPAENAAAIFAKSLEDGYSKMIEDDPSRMAGLLELVAGKLEKGAVLYHCTAGKDRTGVLTAMLYLLCGADERDIIADYQVSATYQGENPMFDLIPPDMRSLLDSKPESMRAFLERAASTDCLALLRGHGLTQGAIDRIREQLVEC